MQENNQDQPLDDQDKVDLLDDAEILAGVSTEDTMLQQELDKVLNTLTERERDVIYLRFGFADGHIWTLEEVGKKFHVTRERIRQIEAQALRKLRRPSRKSQLVEFL